MRAHSLTLTASLIVGLLTTSSMTLAADADDSGHSATRTPVRIDFLDAAYLPNLERIVVAGHYGMVGMIELGDDGAKIKLIKDHPEADFLALARISDGEVLIGGSKGHVYHFEGKSITEIASLSEFNEPVLDIAADESGVWVVGARGLLARSLDGKTFENIEIRDVIVPPMPMPGGKPADWYLGVSNLDPESIEFTATVNGEPAVADQDYIMYPDEGFVQIQNQLDMDPPPTISFKFNPGPPFRAGDVSWNVVLLRDGHVTIAGEFGMILQSDDNGETWHRRDTQIVPHEPEPAYWMSGVQQGNEIWLAGAAGVSQKSTDGGLTWTDNPTSGREGIFGVTLADDGTPIIAGAVGLVGTLDGDHWKLADRTRLKLLSWLKTPISLPDGSVLVMGGRAAAIRYKDGKFTRVPITF